MAYSRKNLSETFRKYLGRNPSDQEAEYLQDFLAKNELSGFEVDEIIQGLPEAQQRRLPQVAGQYGQMLAAGDEDILGRAQSMIGSRFAQMGRSGSSGRAVRRCSGRSVRSGASSGPRPGSGTSWAWPG